MTIDWITVLAQIGNFLLLLWLLKRFLFRPILDGIDAREAEIDARMERAVRAREDSEATEAAYRAKLEALQSARSEITNGERARAEAQADELLGAARERMEQEKRTCQAQLDAEARSFTDRLHRAGARALLAMTRKALGDLADVELEAGMARHLARQAAAMAPEIRAAAGQGRAAVVTSRTALPDAEQAHFAESFAGILPGATLRFETDPDQSPGMVLRLGGAQLAWTVDSYLDGLEAQYGEQLAALGAPAGQGA
ncbi:F0F1 ATP synthase subunit B [Tropicimonas sp. TH_r6]|uniref:F0F1 ATP synthase subunit B family protein n=1 Tax=Tropicimonas sp. TH_r6 TaxID=3082085 RepID=UPI0029545EC3|nr:F0F1 ATP synthase subunit B [Tropicimonas sp. TH_r6]MDV7143254.1 F0F1 ATP synthase subunit B [Tropicimonas sp. TH_r6]